MILPPSTHWFAAMAFERILYCLAEGTALAAAVALALRLVPQKNSRTRFAVWFATLGAVVVLPVIQMGMEMSKGTGASPGTGSSSSAHAILTISSIWGEYIILGLTALAGLGLLRVAAGLWQVRRLRNGCVAIEPQVLGPELQAMIEEFREHRPVSVLVSSRLEVPTAIGFLRPAILIPAWLADDSRPEELKYVLLHELSHLRRWDDWTNLAQKLVKAVLFFHPGVWWIERKMSLDREMACDDAVLAQAGSPRVYAQCLAQVAERSFLRRQIALAQAAVDRMRQLSLRVARILDGDRPRSTRLWKPALPMVAAIALLCAISTSDTPKLVSLRDSPPVAAAASSSASVPVQPLMSGRVEDHRAEAISRNAPALVKMVKMVKFTPPSAATHVRSKASPVVLNARYQDGSYVPAHYAQSRNAAMQTSENLPARDLETFGDPRRAALRPSSFNDSEDAAEAQQHGVVVFVVASRQIISAGSITWQVNMWELRLPAPPAQPTKPVPRKT